MDDAFRFLKVKAGLLLLGGAAETKGLALGLGSQVSVLSNLVLVGKVLFNHLVGLFVNGLVGTVLALVDELHAAGLFDKDGKLVVGAAVGLLVELANLENVVKTIKSDLDDLVVSTGQDVAKRLDAALVDKVADLLGSGKTTRGGVGNGPAGLLSSLEIRGAQEVDQGRDEVAVNDGLDLVRVAGGNVGNSPAGLLADRVLGRGKETKERGQGTRVDDELSLDIVTSDNVSHRSEGGGLNSGRRVAQKVNKTAGETSLDNGLDLFVGTVREVGNGPAGVNQHLVVKGVNELCEGRQSLRNEFPLGLGGLASAKVGEGPCSISNEGELLGVLEELKERVESAGVENLVSAGGGITGNVTEGPNGLFLDLSLGGRQELDKEGDGTGLNDNLGLLARSRGNVCECPSSFKLERGVGRGEELDKSGDDTALNDLLDRGVLFLGEDFSKLGGTV